METRFDPKTIEARWYADWLDKGVFAGKTGDDGPTYSIVIPPPNVTGALHMGHALNNVIQDVYIRHARMCGKNTNWFPGTDHAGIATQNVVERALAKEGLRKEDIGREKFVERVWEWRTEYGGRIINQLKRLGCGCDWDRERFTMDEGLSKAVLEVFVRLYDQGLIFRDKALVNWCPRCRTTLSNEESPAVEEDGHFWDLRYPVTGEEGRYVTVSTTRPETMLGDTAVAVHPDDERYADLHGRTVTLPLMEREIPIVLDGHADPEKGSGAVKITPAHDFDDFLVGKRHDLDPVRVIGEDGKMTGEAGAYAGLDRFEARERVVADLSDRGLLGNVEDRKIPLPHCYRCDEIVEPLLSRQWFVKMRPILEPAAEAVKDGRVKFVPERYRKLYLEWVEKYIDWPISRQLWWGHRIPVYYCADCDATLVARERPDSCTSCGSADLSQDEDVLDTWFSSQLWPFSVMGWPEKTPELETFYPTDLLVTDRGIIYFWVARMVMAGLEFMGEVPFPTVYIHGTILDEIGRRMSKSLGNGIDPIEMIDRFGADAVRFSLMDMVSEGQDIKLSEGRFEKGRNFANKLWNASRFSIMHLERGGALPAERPDADLRLEDRWILARLGRAIEAASASLAAYRMNDAASALYSFVWNEFCDWYLELVKPRLYEEEDADGRDRGAALWTLSKTLGVTLRLLHPFMPFVTEEIHDHLVRARGRTAHTISTGAWPGEADGRPDAAAEEEMEGLIALVRAVRNIRAEMNVPEGAKVEVLVATPDVADRDRAVSYAHHVASLCRAAGFKAEVGLEKPDGAAAGVVGERLVYVPLGDVIDLDAERSRLLKEAEKAEKVVKASAKKLSNRDFLDKAPAAVVAREKEKQEELSARLDAVQKQVASLENL